MRTSTRSMTGDESPSPVKRLGIAFSGQPYSLKKVLEGAQVAEALGFESVWITEDYWTGRDAISVAACVAQATREIRIGTAVVTPYTRHPVLLSMTLNALRQATPNRLILGIGAGKPWEPFLGNQMTEWPPLAAVRETIGLIRELMREGRGSWRGQVVDLACSQAMLREALAPPLDDLPIYIGAYGPRMTKLAGEIADGLLIGTGVRREEIPGRIAHLASGVKEVQRDMSSVDVAALVVAAVGDDGVANENTRRYVVSRVDRLTEAEALTAGFDPKRVAGIQRESRMGRSDSACKLLSREMVEAYTIQGTPSQCVSALESLVDAGVRLPILLPFGGDIHELAKAGSEYIRSA